MDDQLPDGGESASMVELGPRPCEDLPALVTVLTEENQVILGGRSQGRERLGLGPAVAGDEPYAPCAAARKRQGLGAPRFLQDRECFARENVGVPREFQERHRGVEKTEFQNGYCGWVTRTYVRS